MWAGDSVAGTKPTDAGLRGILLRIAYSPGVKAHVGDVRLPEGNTLPIELEYEDFGGSGEPLLLVMGIGAQMIIWHEEFIAQLVERGFRVIRFDNRDVGLSTKLHGVRVSPMRPAMAALRSRSPIGGALHAQRHGDRYCWPVGSSRHRLRPFGWRIHGRDDRADIRDRSSTSSALAHEHHVPPWGTPIRTGGTPTGGAGASQQSASKPRRGDGPR